MVHVKAEMMLTMHVIIHVPPSDHDRKRMERSLEAEQRLPGVPQVWKREHQGAPLHPDVVQGQEEMGERDALPRLLQLFVEVLQVRFFSRAYFASCLFSP